MTYSGLTSSVAAPGRGREVRVPLDGGLLPLAIHSVRHAGLQWRSAVLRPRGVC